MAITAAQFKAKFPEFAGADTDLLTLAIAEGDCFVNDTQWASYADTARLYITAHTFSFNAAGSSAATGVVNSKSVNDVSVGYAIPNALLKSVLGSTPYGAHFLEMRRLVFVTRCI